MGKWRDMHKVFNAWHLGTQPWEPWDPPRRPAITSFQASHRGGRSHCDACDLSLSKSPETPQTETWKLYGHRCGYVVKECKKNMGGCKAFKIFEKVAFWRIGTWFGLVAWWACFVIVIVSLGYYVREETIWNDKINPLVWFCHPFCTVKASQFRAWPLETHMVNETQPFLSLFTRFEKIL